MRCFLQFWRAAGRAPAVVAFGRYATGILVPLSVALAQDALEPFLQGAVLFIFVAAVFLVARMAGLGPSLLAAAFSAPLAEYFFLRQGRSLPGVGVLVPLGLFEVVCVVVAYLTDRLRKLERQALEGSRAREEFLSAATHELKSPLTALRLQANVLERKFDGELVPDVADVRAQAAKLRRTVDRLASLIDVLLDVSRVQAGKLKLERQAVDLAKIAKEVATRFAEESPAPCRLEVKADGPVIGNWDPTRVDQVITNLVSNACKYGDGKPVEICVEADGERARLVVRDGGIGIPSDETGRIFERFERLVENQHVDGAGLGLWITRQIVEAHGGRIRVDSEPGHGSTFVVELRRGSNVERSSATT